MVWTDNKVGEIDPLLLHLNRESELEVGIIGYVGEYLRCCVILVRFQTDFTSANNSISNRQYLISITH